MPPPLFLAVIIIFFVFKIIDLLFTIIFQYPLPIGLSMPPFLQRKGHETNLSGTDNKIFNEKNINLNIKKRKLNGCCGRCQRAYFIATSKSTTI